MAQTITEALAEIATIDKRIAKKPHDIVPYVAWQDMLRDPFEKSGGAAKYIAEQRQSFTDLLKRKIDLRAAIAKANAETVISIDGTERTVADWLVWKRECYQHSLNLLRQLIAQAQKARNEAQKQGLNLVSTPGAGTPQDIIVAVDEQALVEEVDKLEEQYGRLDGLLSLKNATTTIDV